MQTPAPLPPTITLAPPPPPKLRLHKKLVIAIFILLFIPSILFVLFVPFSSSPILSPIGTVTQILGFQDPQLKSDRAVFGFLPYWEFKHADSIRFDLLTHLAVFGVTFDGQGHVVTREADYTEPGWAALNSTSFTHIRRLAKNADAKVILVIKVFDPDDIDSIIFHQEYQDTLIQNTLDLIDSKSYDGVNIDFEYMPEVTPAIQQRFTLFVDRFTRKIKAHNPALEVSLCVFGDSSEGHRIWQIQELGAIVDHVVVMAYDYHRPSSPTAGPVAPLYGGGSLWDKDITTAFSQFTRGVDSRKFLLGVPYYGYEWTTGTTDHLPLTYKDSGATATYRRIQEIIASKSPTLNWDPSSLSPWLTYTDSGYTQQIYYDDTRSLGYKYDFVRQANLGGIAIWALGYDDGYSDLWELIKTKFYTQ